MRHSMVIFDVDGVLFDNRHRLPFIPDYEAYYHPSKMELDPPIEHGLTLLRSLKHHHQVTLNTGRTIRCKDITVKKLQDHNIEVDGLIMRKNDDHRPNAIVKKDNLVLLRQWQMPIIAAFDDNPDAVKMYTWEGITAYLVPPLQ